MMIELDLNQYPMHHGVGRKALPVATLFAFETFLIILPVMVDASALGAEHTLPYPILFQLALAGFLVVKLLGKINQIYLVSLFNGTKLAHDCAIPKRKVYLR